MSASSSKRIVVVRRKGRGHAAHHGGSWKVAYADFVTAMMAFFMVMWIMGMDQSVKDMVQGYFSNPVGFKKSFSGGTNALSAGNFISNLDVARTTFLSRREQEESFNDAADEIRGLVASDSPLGALAAQVEVVVTEEGLRVELMEGAEGAIFFDVSSSALKPALRQMLGLIGGVLREVPGEVVLEGHTDALPYGGAGFSNWELSVDRANAARRELEAGGLGPWRFAEVRGYAERRLKVPEDPLDPHNRRISVLLPFARSEESAPAVSGAPAPAGRVTGSPAGGR